MTFKCSFHWIQIGLFFIPLIGNETHSFVPIDCFSLACLAFLSFVSSPIGIVNTRRDDCTLEDEKMTIDLLLLEVAQIVKRVDKYVCGHACFGNVRIFLQQNNLWNCGFQKTLSPIAEKCYPCIISSLPASRRKVAICGINCLFDDVASVELFRLDYICLFPVMDHDYRFVAVQPVPPTTLKDAVRTFKNILTVHSWPL